MEYIYMILCVTIVLGVLVFIHEGGHFLASRAFGVRVTEFMIGLPGPHVGFKKNGTKFGLTCIPLGGYARVCGMETGPINPHLESVLAAIYRRGQAHPADIARECSISEEDAYDALDQLVSWGSVVAPKKADKTDIYRASEYIPSKKDIRIAKKLCTPSPVAFAEGQARPVNNPSELYELEYSQQYRALPFWKRSVILLAGIVVNLLFAVLAFVIIYSVIGFDYMNKQTGEVSHFNASPLQSLQLGLTYIGLTFQAIMGLFNPQTAAQTVSDSTSIVGIAVMSKEYFAQGLSDALYFMAAISISLGIMNLLPIPPLDGGRFFIEIIQKITRREIPMKAMGFVSMVGMALFICFFLFMLNQDIQRFVFGNWS